MIVGVFLGWQQLDEYNRMPMMVELLFTAGPEEFVRLCDKELPCSRNRALSLLDEVVREGT